MNTETLEIAPEPVKQPSKFDIRNVPVREVEAAYIETRNGDRRAGLRAMSRALRKGRVDREVIDLLKTRHDGGE